MTIPLTSIDPRDQIVRIAAPLAASLGLSVWGVEVAFGGRGLVRVYAEGPDGIDVDQCAELSRLLGLALDVEECLTGPYVLEVSSPGLERVFFTPEQLAGAVGQRIEATLHAALPDWPGRRKLRGRLLAVSGGAAAPSGGAAPASEGNGTGRDEVAVPAVGDTALPSEESGAAERFVLAAEDIARPGEPAPEIAFSFAQAKKVRRLLELPEKTRPGKTRETG